MCSSAGFHYCLVYASHRSLLCLLYRSTQIRWTRVFSYLFKVSQALSWVMLCGDFGVCTCSVVWLWPSLRFLARRHSLFSPPGERERRLIAVTLALSRIANSSFFNQFQEHSSHLSYLLPMGAGPAIHNRLFLSSFLVQSLCRTTAFCW